jgi:hypothetical protein
MDNHTISEAIEMHVADLLSQHPQTALALQTRLTTIRRALCTALQVVDSYHSDHQYAVENDLFDCYQEDRTWITSQLPELLGQVAAELSGEEHKLAIDHGPHCYCAKGNSTII